MAECLLSQSLTLYTTKGNLLAMEKDEDAVDAVRPPLQAEIELRTGRSVEHADAAE